MLCSCRLNKCSISYWQSIMNFNTTKQQIEMIIMKNRWLYSSLLVSIIYLVLFYFNFTAYIGDYLEAEKCGFCIHCNGSVMCGTCKCARTLLHWIVKWWRLSLLHTLWLEWGPTNLNQSKYPPQQDMGLRLEWGLTNPNQFLPLPSHEHGTEIGVRSNKSRTIPTSSFTWTSFSRTLDTARTLWVSTLRTNFDTHTH